MTRTEMLAYKVGTKAGDLRLGHIEILKKDANPQTRLPRRSSSFAEVQERLSELTRRQFSSRFADELGFTNKMTWKVLYNPNALSAFHLATDDPSTLVTVDNAKAIVEIRSQLDKDEIVRFDKILASSTMLDSSGQIRGIAFSIGPEGKISTAMVSVSNRELPPALKETHHHNAVTSYAFASEELPAMKLHELTRMNQAMVDQTDGHRRGLRFNGSPDGTYFAVHPLSDYRNPGFTTKISDEIVVVSFDPKNRDPKRIAAGEDTAADESTTPWELELDLGLILAE